jgi:hypothetical protein
MVNAGSMAASIAIYFGFQKGDNILETLDKGTIFTDVLKEGWRQQFEQYKIVSFWGNKDTVSYIGLLLCSVRNSSNPFHHFLDRAERKFEIWIGGHARENHPTICRP